MEAPNAPNPENPNAQGDQNQDQNQDQVPAGPAPAPAPAQPVPQPAPAGVIPQIFYQNWIGKKPEFSGKPEEDAESHLISTRDWMEAHNFPEGEKVRHFRVTLTGEARLWYESLTPIDNDWPALQNKFRWQYSKIGNTPEQLFHAWRTFKFDKNTDSIDSYVLRMSQVAAMLNYGEMQILENFKNTLPYQLYSTLINVNNLRDAVDLAKRVLTKEKLDRQLTGQSSTPFMKATSHNDSHSPQNQQKKGVTFDVMETLERNSDCIDRLTTLVTDLKMTMDRKQPQYKPKYTRVGPEIKMQVDTILPPEKDPLVEEGIKVVIEEIITIGTITGKIIEIDQEADGTITGQVIGVIITHITTDEVMQDSSTDKIHNRHLETEVKVEVEMKTMVMINLEVEVEIEIKGDKRNAGLDLIQG